MTAANPSNPLTRARRQLLETVRAIDDWFYDGTRETRILFVFPDPYGFACQTPIIPHLQAYADVDVRVVWDRSGIRPNSAFASARDEELYRSLHMDPLRASLRKWHIVVYSHLCRFHPRRRALRAYLHHGAGFGSGGGLAAARAFEIYLGLSVAEKLFLEARSSDLFEESRAFFPVGFPKADVLLDGSSTRAAVLSQLKLPDRRTLLITSHYRPTSTLRSLGPRIFREIAANFPHCNVIQTGHPWLWQETGDADDKWRRPLLTELNAIATQYPNARLVTDMLAEPLAVASDLLIADYSSVVTTFGLLDRPIVFYANPAIEVRSTTAFQLYCDAAHVFSALDDTVEICRAALKAPQAKIAGRKILREAFYANAGTSAKVTAEVLRAIGPVCTVRSPRWQRILALSRAYCDGAQA